MLKMAEFPERCSLTLVAKCFLFYQYRFGSCHKNRQKYKRPLLVGLVEFHLSEKSSF